MKKKHFLVLAATIVAVVGTALLASCEKEDITQTPAMQEPTTLDVQEKYHVIWATPLMMHCGFDEVDPNNIYATSQDWGMQFSQYVVIEDEYGYRRSGNQYDCGFGNESCKIGCDGSLAFFSNYPKGHLMGILRNANEEATQLVYIYDTDILEEEGITLGNTLVMSKSVPIQDSYHLGLAPENTTLFIPAGEYTLNHVDRAIWFSVDVNNLIRDTNLVIFK